MEVSMRATNMELCETIAASNNMIALEVPGRGDCQYESVIACLRRVNYMESLTVASLRRRVAHEILNDADRYQPFLADNDGSIVAYAQSVMYNRWGDELTLRAIASTLNIHVTVYQFSSAAQTINEIGSNDAEYRIFLTLDNRSELAAHYGALVAGHDQVPCTTTGRVVESVSEQSVDEVSTPMSSKKYSFGCRSHRCSQCGKFFAKLAGLRMHTLNKHRTESCSSSSANVQGIEIDNSVSARVPVNEITEINPRDTPLSHDSTMSKHMTDNCSSSSAKAQGTKIDGSVSATLPEHGIAANNPHDTPLSRHSFKTPEEHTNVKPTRCGNTRKERIAKDFRKSVEDLRKTRRPSVAKGNQQIDPLYDRLKEYHDCLLLTVDNVTTQKLTAEVLNVLSDPSKVDEINRAFQWSSDDEQRLNKLNVETKKLQMRDDWYWRSDKNSKHRVYNEQRMKLCVDREFVEEVIHCPQCESTGLLVGADQVGSVLCYDCVKVNTIRSDCEKAKMTDAWNKVRPEIVYPKRTEMGHEHEDLAYLYAGDRAVIAPILPIVSLSKNYYGDRRLRQESISLQQDPVPTWCKVLPRSHLKDRFMVIENTSTKSGKRHVVADPERVAQWLRYLFKNHKIFIEKEQNYELELNLAAVQGLVRTELAEVLEDVEEEDQRGEKDRQGIVQANLESGFSRTDVFSFDKYPHLYLRAKEFLRIKQSGLIEIIQNPSERRPTYNSSANMAFPYLYAKGGPSPLDFCDYKLSRYLLKKQTLFAHVMSDGKYVYHYAEDDIHMMYLFARLMEQTVHAKIGFYISQHPDVAHLPMNAILEAFRDGPTDQGLLDSKLSDISALMTKMPNSKQKWFCERMGLEAISRDLGDANLFLTVNMDPRAWPDVRRLIYKLENGKDMPDDEPFETNTEKFTNLMSKYAAHVSIYLCRKVKIFLRAFLTDVCRIPERQTTADWTKQDRTANGWFWQRVEFTETRGVQHWHCLVKLPNVLDTALLGRIINNGRVVRQEIKCGNIARGKSEEAWQMVEMGLLASRYVTLFADSISTSAFYSEELEVGVHDPTKVVNLEQLRNEYVTEYKAGNVTRRTHPIMRTYGDAECDPNENIELARVAAVSCQHHCIKKCCGGNLTGKGCRFDFPKKKLSYTVPAVMQLNSEQMETRVLLKRTCDRTANLNPYFLKYFRANHDATVLVDAGHKMRYATKYASKSDHSAELLNEVIDYLNKRSTDVLPPNMKQVLSHLVLADCSHRSFMSKQELAYKVMNLPVVRKSFPDVNVVGFYRRANVTQSSDDADVIIYSDRTEYSAYAERCRDSTTIEISRGDKNKLTREELAAMNLREFAETINYRWIPNRQQEQTLIGGNTRRKLRTRDVNSGHWVMKRNTSRRHTRWSTVLYTPPAIQYEPVEFGKTTSQLMYFDLPAEKRNHLYRSYQELVCYVPWKESPEESFLSQAVQTSLDEELQDPEKDQRYSLYRLEEFNRVYQRMWHNGEIAPPGTQWARDNQFSFSLYLANIHNKDIHLERVDNKGILKARYEAADELTDLDVDIRPEIYDEVDECDFPSALNFLPPDTFREIMEQSPPNMSEISVAFPLQHDWQLLEDLVMINRSKLFMADPPKCPVRYEEMTAMQQFAVERAVDPNQQILYICGQAGSGKTTVALEICERFVGKVQAGAGTGKAASLFNGPTTHSMFGWSHNEFQESKASASHNRKMGQFRTFYENTDVFIIDELNAMSASSLALLDDTMTQMFNPNLKRYKQQLLPFGGKKMIFLGDPAQLRPVSGAAIYDDRSVTASINQPNTKSRKAASLYNQRTLKGQELYRKYIEPNVVYLQQGKRNSGLLQELCTRLRNGEQTAEDLNKLTCMSRNFPDFQTDYGIHYDNETCASFNWRQLWSECKSESKRLYICKASYHVTNDNHSVVDGLSAIPSNKYGFAPDVLCVAEGCEVRLVKNINVSAGLVNSAIGYVVKVLYNNADVPAVVEGRNPPPHCLIVDFPSFQGFISSERSERIHPIPQHPNWVPIFKLKFYPSSVPTWIRKKQSTSQWYREQFPLDLSRHITAHRAQGQTLANRTVMVDLRLNSPDSSLPDDVSSILYVACTRVNTLKDLFVAPIFPTLWEKMGKSERDLQRRLVETRLRRATNEFCSRHGKYDEMKTELSWTPDVSQNPREWKEIMSMSALSRPSSARRSYPEAAGDNLRATNGGCDVPLHLKPVRRERHIGIDQGRRNFAIAVVDKTIDGQPTVMAAENRDLGLSQTFTVSDVFLALREKTSLMSWMQQAEPSLREVDRVIVHIEQMALENPHAKKFSIELGKLLQRQVGDVDTCVIKLSQPHVHRANGPIFRMGSKIVDALKLTPVTYQRGSGQRKRPATNVGIPAKRRRIASSSSPECDDVEPDSDESVPVNSDYAKKKKMSADVFMYFVEADEAEQEDLNINVGLEFQSTWQAIISADPNVKLDDVGDALLHALNDVLCGGSNYKQLTPAASALHTNRTVAVAMFPELTFWAVIYCTWNTFQLENFGVYKSKLTDCYYKNARTVELIEKQLQDELKLAITSMRGEPTYTAVDHIKIVVKQLSRTEEHNLTRLEAGALTNATVEAMRSLCDKSCSAQSLTSDIHDRLLGTVYTRTDPSTGQKYQVFRSAGKHTNAILACLEWMRGKAGSFVESRRNSMTSDERLSFFTALEEVASVGGSGRMEMLHLSDIFREKLRSNEMNDATRKITADLILIAINRNQQHVKSIAANYRKVPTRSAVTVESKRNRPASNETETATEAADVEPQTEDAVCTCTSSDRTSCIATRHFMLRMDDIQRRN